MPKPLSDFFVVEAPKVEPLDGQETSFAKGAVNAARIEVALGLIAFFVILWAMAINKPRHETALTMRSYSESEVTR